MKSRDREMGIQSIDRVSPSDLTITSPVGDYIRPESLHVNAMYSIINGIDGCGGSALNPRTAVLYSCCCARKFIWVSPGETHPIGIE